MILTYNELLTLIEHAHIAPVPREHVNGASIDVTLGSMFWREGSPASTTAVDLMGKEAPYMSACELYPNECFVLKPGEFCLAQTSEVFNLPCDVAAEFRLKSSVARAGLNNSMAGWCDPGWHGSVLTMQLHNVLKHHALLLRPGMKIGQMIFYRGAPVPGHADYAARGQYNGDQRAQPSRGIQ